MPRATFDTALGRCGLAWGESGVTRFWLPEAAPLADDVAMPAEIASIASRVQRHLSGELQDFGDVRFDFAPLPDFLVAVLRATLAIPPGATRSYGQIAAACGQPPAASRAVGRALGENPWPLLIPCHRVISASGKMTGFSGPGGVATKLRLLALEGAELFPI